MKISIIIPIYNKAKYLNNLISDLLGQTYTEFECILVDDGSDDGSSKICDDISEIDRRFRTIHLRNGGVSNARNHGISQSEGEYITFIDADDRLYPEYLANLHQCIIINGVDLVISGLEKYWDESDRKVLVNPPYYGKCDKHKILPEFVSVQKETGIYGFCVAKIFKRDLIKEIRFDSSLSLAEDFDFYLKLYRKIRTIYFDDKCYYRYLQEADNSSAVIEDNQIDYFAQLKIKLRLKQFLIEEEVYTNINKQIIDEMIADYVYFVLFYSSMKELENNFTELKKIVVDDVFILREKCILQKYILVFYRYNCVPMIKFALASYRSLKTIVKLLI